MDKKNANTHKHLDVTKKLTVLFNIFSSIQFYHATDSPHVPNHL